MISDWARQLNVAANISKTVCMLISYIASIDFPNLYLNGDTLLRVDNQLHLGMVIGS